MSDSPYVNCSVSIGDNSIGSVIQTGDGNSGSITFQQATLPPSEQVDMAAVLAALEVILSELDSPDRRKMTNAVDDAKGELSKPEPNKDEVGLALDRALGYAQKANGFAEAIDKLRPHVEKAAGWLGEHGYKLLPLVGLTL